MKDPAVLFYTSDFLTGTSRFSDEETGRYIKALCNQHQCGHFTKEELLFFLKSYDSLVWSKFTQDSDGKYYNVRMETEILNRLEYCNSRSHKGLAGRKAVNHTKSIRLSYGNHTEDENDNVIVNEIYNQYPVKDINNDNRSTSKSQKDKNKIRVIIKTILPDKLKLLITNYVAECNRTKTYLKNFSAFLNQLPEVEVSKSPEPPKPKFVC